MANRQYTCDLLQKLRIVYSGPWLVMGDFNVILSQDDKEGGGVKSEAQIEAFRNFLGICELQPLDYKVNRFTWIRNTTDCCIKKDWNGHWLTIFNNVQFIRHLGIKKNLDL